MFFFVPKSTTMKSLLTTSTLPLISPLLTLPKSKPPLFTPSFHQQPLNTPFLHLGNSSSLFCRDSVRFCSSVSDDESRLQRREGKGQGCWGEIHVIVGPMFAGKTTTLLRRVQSEVANGRSVAIIKSNKDTRYGLDSIVTHDGDKYPCLPLKDLSSFRQMFGARAYDELDVIGIDEAQFFDDLYDFCQKAADQDSKTVIVAGLDGDYLRRSFGSVLDIIPLADSVTKLTARCEMCGKLAHFTLRKTDETKTELIGGADKYMPVCRRHYISGQVVIEATRTILQEKVQLA